MTEAGILTPGDLARRLSTSDRTVRRLAENYERVFGPLLQDNRRHRLFPPDAVERLEQAARYMRDAPGASTLEVMEALRDGRALPQRERTPGADTLAPLLAELHAIRLELAELRALVLTLRDPDDRDQPPMDGDQPRPERHTRSQTELLERMKAGMRVVQDRDGRYVESSPGGENRPVDPRTVKALLQRGLLTRDGAEVRLNMNRLLPSS